MNFTIIICLTLEYFGALHQKVQLLQRAAEGLSAPFGSLWPFLGASGPFWRTTASASTTNEFLSSSTLFLIPNMLKLAQKRLKKPKLCEITWKLHESVWKCMKILPLTFLAHVHAFWYPACWNWTKNGWNSQNWVKLCENCVKLHEGVHECVWKYLHWISQLEYMHFDTQHVEIGPKMAEIAKIAWYCVKLRIRHAFAKPAPNISQTPQLDLTWLRNQCEQKETHTHTHASVLYIRIIWQSP